MNLGRKLRKLLDIGSEALGQEPSRFSPDARWGNAGLQLQSLLDMRNGFYAFESALLVRPSGIPGKPEIHGLEEWNRRDLWVDAYEGMAEGCYFFAEDAFGGQFCLAERGIYVFDPETGEKNFVAEDLEGWASEILKDYEVLTGYPLAHTWQTQNGRLPEGKRLIPRVPFVLGGDFELGNLFPTDDLQAMRSRASIAVQIRDLPDGASIKLKIED